MGPNHSQRPTAGIVIGAMAPTCVEQHESLMAQERLHLGKPDAPRRPPHLLDQFLPLAQESSSDSSVTSSLSVGAATPSWIALWSLPSTPWSRKPMSSISR